MKIPMTPASPPPNPGSAGKIGRTLEESEPAWVAPKSARPGSPNIVVIYMDDMGYSDIGPAQSISTGASRACPRCRSNMMSRPAQIRDAGQIRSQFAHVTDVMPTLLEMAGVAPLSRSHGETITAVSFDRDKITL